MRDGQDIRASFLRFPAWSQNFWTWLTGKALPGQQPLFVHAWWSYLLVTLSLYVGGVAVSAWAWLARPEAWWPLLILAGWIMTVNGARTIFLVILHQCVHKQLSGNRMLDQHIGEVAAILVMNQSYGQFKHAHFVVHHNHRTFATIEDPPVSRMVSLGIRPGMSKRQLWQRSLQVMVSPLFHAQTFWSRIRSNLTSPNTFQTVVLVLFVAALAFAHVLLPGGVLTMAIAFWIPLIVFVQISALLDHLGEHGWLMPADLTLPTRYRHADQSWARFNGCVVPPKGLPPARAVHAWVAWTLQMLFYHLPVRLLVVVGDLPNHDFHHRHPGSRDWMIAAYARQRDIDSATVADPEYLEFWGLGRAVDHVLDGISKAPAVQTMRLESA
ncbi:MAG: hypothetical protein ACYC22_05595 [Thiomonas delicata]